MKDRSSEMVCRGQISSGKGPLTFWGGLNYKKKSMIYMQRRKRYVKTVHRLGRAIF